MSLIAGRYVFASWLENKRTSLSGVVIKGLGCLFGEKVWGMVFLSSALSTVFSPAAVYAVDWSLDANGGLSEMYNDNPRLNDSEQKSIWGHRLNVSTQLYARSPLTELRLQPAVTMERYAGASDLNNDVVQVGLDTQHQWERAYAALSLAWQGDTTLTSELEDTGYIQATKDRILKTVHPVLGYTWSERLESSVYFDYLDVSYIDAQLTGLADYYQRSLGVVMAYQWSSNDSLEMELYGKRYKSPRFKYQVATTGVQVNYEHALYRYTKLSLTLGAFQLRSDLGLPYIDYESVDNHFLGEIFVSQQRDTLSWKAGLRRSIDPSGSGLIQNDRFDLTFGRRFSPFWQANFGVQYFQNETLQSELGFDRRRYSRLSGQLVRALTPSWRLSAQYIYQWQEYASSDHGARGNQLIVNISYDMAEKHLWP